MKLLSQILFWAGIVSIPLSWLMWYFGPEIEIGRQVVSNIDDPALRAVLMEAHAERWGIFCSNLAGNSFGIELYTRKEIQITMELLS